MKQPFHDINNEIASDALDELDALETRLKGLSPKDEEVLFADALRQTIILNAIETALAAQ